MKFNYKKMNKEYAEEIAYKWKYKGLYSFYDITSDEDDLEEYLQKTNGGEYEFYKMKLDLNGRYENEY